MPDDTAKWPAFVAIAILVVVAAIAMTSLIRYPVDDAMTVLNWLGPLLGVVTGAFVGFFFTRGQIQTAKDLAETSTKQAAQSMEIADSAMEDANKAQERATNLEKVVTKMAGGLDPGKFDALMESDEALREALK